jgi:lipopolysaccharide biosynthesis regulator YciM
MKTLGTVSLLLAFFACATHLSAADHPWIEVQSDHFTVLCNSGEKDAREAAADLERIRLVLFKILPGFRLDPNVPIVVFITADDDLYGSLVPDYNKRSRSDKNYSVVRAGRDLNLIVSKSGIFQGGRMQHDIVLSAGAIEPTDYKMKWDYGDLMARVNFRRAPFWFRSGLGDFFALSLITDDQAKLGLPIKRYAAVLGDSYANQARPGLPASRYTSPASDHPLIPLPTLVTMTTSSPEYKEEVQQRSFYAESWGLFHYLMLADQGAHRPQLERYLQLLAQGKKQLDAAQEAFGDLVNLQDKLRVYYKSFAYPYVSIPLPRPDSGQEFSARTLTAAESNAWLAEYYLRSKRTAEAKPLIDSALTDNLPPSRAHEAMGIYYLEQADYLNALKEFSAATAGDSKLFLSYYYKGVLSSYGKSGTEIPVDSEADLRRAVQLNPRYAPASLALARLIVRRGGSPAEAVGLARQAVESEHDVVRYHLAYANILLQAGDAAKAEAEARQSLENKLPASEEEDAKSLLLLAQMCLSAAPCKALGYDVSVESVPARAAPPPSSGLGAPANASAQAANAPTSSIRGVVRSLACNPDGRVLTLAVGEKILVFSMIKKPYMSTPETFWLAPSYIDICKNLAGEPGEVFFKSGQPDSAPLEATALQILDRF